jgi:glycosyltransferase involved in cell wall biosynthesis
MSAIFQQFWLKEGISKGEFMSGLRILLLGPDSNPEAVSIPFVIYSNAAALAELHEVTLLVRSTVEEPVRRAKAAFKSVEVVRMPLLERFYAWALRRIFKYNYDTQALTAFGYPYALAFEWNAWRQFRKRIRAGEFDVVLRLMPMAPTLPSPFAFFLRKGPVPFVLGPLNGGLRSAPGFSQSDKRAEWVWTVRNLYRYLPFARSTYRYAAAIIIASYHMRAEFAAYRDKMFFIPENGIARSLCLPDSRIPEPGAKLKLIFIGGLVPRKACYIGLRAAAPLLRKDLAHFTIIGDGPERERLEELAKSLEIEKGVSFCGWLSHAEVLKRLRSSDVAVLPAIREGGGGVVFEALAGGAVPVVLDHGGPGDIVHSEVGYKVPPSNENNVVSEMENILAELASNRDLLHRLRQKGMSYAQKCLTWDAKARSVTSVLRWVLRQGPKPDLRPATILQARSETVEIPARS